MKFEAGYHTHYNQKKISQQGIENLDGLSNQAASNQLQPNQECNHNHIEDEESHTDKSC